MSLLAVEGVSKQFVRGRESVTALAGVDLTIEAGEFVSLVGPSGSGKSTLLHLAGGLDRPDHGVVRLRGVGWERCSVRDRARMRRRRIGFVFQFFHLLPNLTVAENVALPLALDGTRADARVRSLIDAVGLSHRANHLPSELSGGEMQRAAVARSLVAEPHLILADEPTGNLDSVTGADVLELLVTQVRQLGAALLMVTHDPSAAAHGDRRLSLRDGRLVDLEPGVINLDASRVEVRGEGGGEAAIPVAGGTGIAGTGTGAL